MGVEGAEDGLLLTRRGRGSPAELLPPRVLGPALMASDAEHVSVSVAEEKVGLLAATPAVAPAKPSEEKKLSALSSWRRIWAEARDVRPALAVGTAFLVLASASFSALPYLAGKLLDAVATDTAGNAAAARRRLNSVALQLILLAFVSGALSGTRAYIFNSASERVVARIRARLFRALLRQDMTFFDENVSGASRPLGRLAAERRRSYLLGSRRLVVEPHNCGYGAAA